MLKRIRSLLDRLSGSPAPADPLPAMTEAPEPVARPEVHRGPNVVHRPIPAAELDPDAVKIISRLTRFDHTAYLVGGCVRDLLLDRRPKDFDVGTSATPRQIKRLFRNSRIIGRRFRLAQVYFQTGKIIEVATFRARDVPDEDAEEGGAARDLLIRDDNVFGTPEEDALRRDFTINALFYDLNNGTVIDHADGLSDLRRGLVRTIGDPEIRFREDPIRILRAIKFAARLEFEIEARTLEALRRTRHEIPKAAAPRILEEINRLCREGAARRSFELLRDTEVFPVLFPELVDAYARLQGAWDLLLDLVSETDRDRGANAREQRLGETWAALVLPPLAEGMGWNDDGTVTAPHGLNVRLAIEDRLQPLAVRLRVPRREQELCRQILGTLFRMVPVERVRRGARRALRQRECFPMALRMLRAAAARRGGAFAQALTFWEAGTEEARPPEREPARDPAREASAAPPRRSRSRRRGRGGQRAAGSAPSPEGTGPQPRRELPPPWDDGYFFAALPSAPDLAGEGDEDRLTGYAGAVVEPVERKDALPDPTRSDSPPISSNPAPPARPRRRRRHRPRRRGASAKTNESAPPSDVGGSRSDPDDDRED